MKITKTPKLPMSGGLTDLSPEYSPPNSYKDVVNFLPVNTGLRKRPGIEILEKVAENQNLYMNDTWYHVEINQSNTEISVDVDGNGVGTFDSPDYKIPILKYAEEEDQYGVMDQIYTVESENLDIIYYDSFEVIDIGHDVSLIPLGVIKLLVEDPLTGSMKNYFRILFLRYYEDAFEPFVISCPREFFNTVPTKWLFYKGRIGAVLSDVLKFSSVIDFKFLMSSETGNALNVNQPFYSFSFDQYPILPRMQEHKKYFTVGPEVYSSFEDFFLQRLQEHYTTNESASIDMFKDEVFNKVESIITDVGFHAQEIYSTGNPNTEIERVKKIGDRIYYLDDGPSGYYDLETEEYIDLPLLAGRKDITNNRIASVDELGYITMYDLDGEILWTDLYPDFSFWSPEPNSEHLPHTVSINNETVFVAHAYGYFKAESGGITVLAYNPGTPIHYRTIRTNDNYIFLDRGDDIQLRKHDGTFIGNSIIGDHPIFLKPVDETGKIVWVTDRLFKDTYKYNIETHTKSDELDVDLEPGEYITCLDIQNSTYYFGTNYGNIYIHLEGSNVFEHIHGSNSFGTCIASLAIDNYKHIYFGYYRGGFPLHYGLRIKGYSSSIDDELNEAIDYVMAQEITPQITTTILNNFLINLSSKDPFLEVDSFGLEFKADYGDVMQELMVEILGDLASVTLLPNIKLFTEILPTSPISLDIGHPIHRILQYNEGFLIVGTRAQSFLYGDPFTPQTIALTPISELEIQSIKKFKDIVLIHTGHSLREYRSQFNTIQPFTREISQQIPDTIQDYSGPMIILDDAHLLLGHKDDGTKGLLVRQLRTDEGHRYEFTKFTLAYPIVQHISDTYVITDINNTKYLCNLNLKSGNFLDFQGNFEDDHVANIDAHEDFRYVEVPYYESEPEQPVIHTKEEIDLNGWIQEGSDRYAGILIPGSLDLLKYIPRDRFNNISQIDHLQARKISVGYSGVDFVLDINEGLNEREFVNTGVHLGTTLINGLVPKEHEVSSLIYGYTDTQLRLHTNTIYPLTFYTLAYELMTLRRW